jgi:hypothetical protein
MLLKSPYLPVLGCIGFVPPCPKDILILRRHSVVVVGVACTTQDTFAESPENHFEKKTRPNTGYRSPFVVGMKNDISFSVTL